MADLLLWRRLTPTDFLAINGKAAPAGGGGGAMHIALGTAPDAKISVANFLGSTKNPATIETEPQPPNIPKAKLTFHGNPKRRGGEWRITDQVHNRHPRWTTARGFPAAYDPANRPIVFVVRVDGRFNVRFGDEAHLAKDAPSLYQLVSASKTKNTGIVPLNPSWSVALRIEGSVDTLQEYDDIAEAIGKANADSFDPANVEDGRKKILAAVVRRQGQQAFRKKLLLAYKRCAVTGCSVELTLEAAHITPYLGAKTNHISNGILLRADIHTLFDLGLITVDAETHRTKVSPLLKGSEYEELDSLKIRLPKDEGDRPSHAALLEHMKTFRSEEQ